MSMSVELDESFDPPGGNHLASYCKPAYRVRWLKNKGAILILFWNYLVLTTYYLFRAGYKEKQLDNPFHVTDTGIILACAAILFPIGGWLADTRIGRYKMIHYSMLMMWLGTILATLGLLLTTIVSSEHHQVIQMTIYCSLCVFVAIGLGGFLSNIIHLGIDQLADASANEITSFISWYTASLYISGITVYYITDCVVSSLNDIYYIQAFAVSFFLTVAVCLDFFFHHILVKEEVSGNFSLRIVINVVKYVVRNRRSRYSVSSQGVVSRFDIAKHMYGGPFTSQQVDSVRKFITISIIIATCAIPFGSVHPLSYADKKVQGHLHMWKEETSIDKCYENITLRHSDQLIIIVIVLLYEFVLHPIFYRCCLRIRIISKFVFATALFFLWVLSLLITQSIIYQQRLVPYNNSSKSCLIVKHAAVNLSYMWMLIPSFLEGISQYLLLSSGLEFIWAYAPTSMKGLTLGLGFMLVGVYTMIHTAISSPFIFHDIAKHIPWDLVPLTCDIWYFLLEGIIIFVVLLVMVVVVRVYDKQKERPAHNPYLGQYTQLED